MPTMSERSLSTRARRWQAPAFAVLMGVVFLVGGAARGRVGLGLAMAAIMFGYAAFLIAFTRRVESIALLAEESVDERRAHIQLRANAMTGNVLITVILGAFLVQLFTGGDTRIWTALGALGALTYLATVFVLSRRG